MPKKTFVVAKETENDLLVGLKDNQKTLLTDCQLQATDAAPNDTAITIDKARGRKETRQVACYRVGNFYDSDWNELIQTFIVVNRMVEKRVKGKIITTTETSHYVCSSNKYSAEDYNKAIRQHWHIENKNHYVRDVTFREDDAKIKFGAMQMAILKSIVLNTIRVNEKKTNYIPDILYENSLIFNKVINYVI